MASKGYAGKVVKERLTWAGAHAVVDAQFRTDVLLNPDTASCEGNSKICVIFDETPETLISDKDQVEICVQMNEKSVRIVATQINQRTFFFSAPNNSEGDATVVVFVNGTEVASSYLRYRSDTVHLVYGLSQIYLQFFSTVCRYMYTLQTKHQIQSPIPELDRLLAETFDDKDNKHNIPAKAFEELFDIIRHSSTDVVQSMYELPTLLHLSGDYGLEHLVTRLMNLPGANTASDLFNRNGRTASELALDNGYLKLAKTLNTSMKANSSLEDAEKPLNTPASGSKVNNSMSNDLDLPPKQSAFNLGLQNCFADEEGDYMLLADAASPTDFDESRGFCPQRQQPFDAMIASRKPPPAPCQKFLHIEPAGPVIPRSITFETRDVTLYIYRCIESEACRSCSSYFRHKMLSSSIPESQAELFSRSSQPSGGTAPPPVPRRKSRNSGVNVDGDVTGPISTPNRRRPPLTKGDTEPIFVYYEEGHHYVPSRKSNQETTEKKFFQRNFMSVSGEENAPQLKKTGSSTTWK